MKILFVLSLFLTSLVIPASAFSGGPTPSPTTNFLPLIQKASPYKFPKYTVTNVIIVPADIDLDPDYPRLVSEAVKTVQARYSELLDGQTFQINQENGDPVILKSSKSLGYFCNPRCEPGPMDDELKNNGFPVFQNQTVLNVFGAGFRSFGTGGLGDWNKSTDSGMTWMGEAVLKGLKGTQRRESEILCAAMSGMSCDASERMRIIAHELGHSFGLLMASRWAKSHSCTVTSPNECQDDLDPKFRPGKEESRSIMSYASNLQYTFNDSCVNPEKTLLKNSKFFGGKGYGGLNFENCLSPITEEIKIVGIEANEKVYPGDTIVLQTEGLRPTDKETRIFFGPASDLALSSIKIGMNRLQVVVPPRAYGSGYIFVTATRENNRTVKSNPYKIGISGFFPRLDSIDPPQAKTGDIITITGENFVIDTEIIKSLVPIVHIGGLQVEDFIEYDNKHIKLQIPQNVSLGKNNVSVEVSFLQKGFQTPTYSESANLPLQITGSTVISAKLEGPSTAQVGKTITFLVTIDSENTFFDSAEVLVQISEANKSCNERRGNWCKIGSTALPAKVIMNTPYTPQQTGSYLAVINAYGKEGVKCSGDPGRPPDWVDCGEQSRLKIQVYSNQINVNYSIQNNSEKGIVVLPKICEIINGIRECRDSGYTEILEPNTFRGFSHTFDRGVEGFTIKEGAQYEVSCYFYTVEGEKGGRLVSNCPSRITRAGETVNINTTIKKDGSIESFESSPAGSLTAQNLQKSVVGILVNGARMNFANKISIHLPETIIRGETHPIPITVSYGGEGSVRENSRSQILVFRYVVPGGENSGKSFDKGQACDPAKYSCFVMSEQESGSPERLFCRNMGDGYKWVTQKHAYELCQGKDGITSACKNKEGDETTYYCTGQDWVDKEGWAVHQEKVKRIQEALKPHEVLPSGKIAEDIKETQKRLEEESKGLSCSLEARPQGIKVGGDIAWTIETQNFTGVSAQWHGTDNGQELVIPVPVHEFPKPNSPNSWTESYPYQRGGIYIRYALIKDSEGRTCQTNALGVVIEDSNIAQGILPKVGEIPSSISSIVGQIPPKTIKRILLILPPYGREQEREVRPGDKIQFSLPDTGGEPQKFQAGIDVFFSDGNNHTTPIFFVHKGNTCALSNGRCADSNGNTQDNYHCDEFRSDLSGCSLEKDRAHPYCYTKCTPKPTGGTTSPVTPSQPTPSQPQNLNCVANGGVCTDSGGNTKDGTLKNCKNYWDLYSKAAGGCTDGDYIWCYEKASCTPGTVQPATCNGSGEYCADSGGTPKNSGNQCITGNKAYRNNSSKDVWCQNGEPGWYCWLCQQ